MGQEQEGTSKEFAAPGADDASLAWLSEHAATEAPVEVAVPTEGVAATEPAPVAETAQEPAEGQAAESTPQTSDEHTKALETLKRHWSKSVQAKMLDGLSADDAIAEATRLDARNASYDTQESQMDLLRKELEQLKGAKPQESETETRVEAPPSQGLEDVLASLDPDLYGDDLRPALTKLADVVRQETLRDTAALISANDSRVDGILTQYIDGDVRRQLGDEFPSLRDSTKYGDVVQAMKEIEPVMNFADSDGPRERREKLMRRAAQITFPGDVSLKPDKLPGKASGQMTPPTPKSQSEGAPMTNQEKDMKFLSVYTATGSAAQARKAAGF